jgi:hypothetical protein
VLLCADAAAASVGLAGGLLGLPIVQHRAAGAVGHGAERVIRLLDGAMARLRPDRARCWSCKRTHILLPAWYAPRRADAIEVIGTPQPQLRATPRTWWLTVPCGRSRPRSPPCAPSRSGCRSRRAGAIGGSWHAALGTLLWAGLVRVTLLQHVTWSVNSLCHVIGTRPFITRRHDRATNLWLPALLSLGESWHSMHHSDPACARHGADPRQIEISAAVIRIFERLGLGHQRALARPRLPGVPPPRSGSAPASAGTPDSEALISPAPT